MNTNNKSYQYTASMDVENGYCQYNQQILTCDATLLFKVCSLLKANKIPYNYNQSMPQPDSYFDDNYFRSNNLINYQINFSHCEVIYEKILDKIKTIDSSLYKKKLIVEKKSECSKEA